VNVYYAPGSATYHVDRTCYPLRRSAPVFHRDVKTVGAEITNPMGHGSQDKLRPCRVCVEGFKPAAGGFGPIVYGSRAR